MIKATIMVSLMGLISISSFANRAEHKEAMKSACVGKQVEESCSFEGKRGQVSGACVESRKEEGVLICKDPNRKKRRRGNR